MEKNSQKTRQNIPSKRIEVNNESTGIAQREPVFFDTTYQHKTSEKELRKRKEEIRNAIPNDPPVMTVSCSYKNDLHKVTTIVNEA